VSTCSRFLRQEGVGGADVTKNRPREDCCLDVYGPTSESLSWLSVMLCYLVSCAQSVCALLEEVRKSLLTSVSLLECDTA
jgi:hypothetical protein